MNGTLALDSYWMVGEFRSPLSTLIYLSEEGFRFVFWLEFLVLDQVP